MDKVKVVLQWAGDRLREPSSYAGLVGLLLAYHLKDAAGVAGVVEAFGVAVGGLIALVMPEAKA